MELFVNFVKFAMIVVQLPVGSADWNDLIGGANIHQTSSTTTLRKNSWPAKLLFVKFVMILVLLLVGSAIWLSMPIFWPSTWKTG